MSLKKETREDTPRITVSALEMKRMHELWDVMNDVGLASMTVNELEEWSYLMAKSLEGKGNRPIRELSTKIADLPPNAV